MVRPSHVCCLIVYLFVCRWRLGLDKYGGDSELPHCCNGKFLAIISSSSGGGRVGTFRRSDFPSPHYLPLGLRGCHILETVTDELLGHICSMGKDFKIQSSHNHIWQVTGTEKKESLKHRLRTILVTKNSGRYLTIVQI